MLSKPLAISLAPQLKPSARNTIPLLHSRSLGCLVFVNIVHTAIFLKCNMNTLLLYLKTFNYHVSPKIEHVSYVGKRSFAIQPPLYFSVPSPFVASIHLISSVCELISSSPNLLMWLCLCPWCCFHSFFRTQLNYHFLLTTALPGETQLFPPLFIVNLRTCCWNLSCSLGCSSRAEAINTIHLWLSII